MAFAGKNVKVLVAGYDRTGDSNKLMMNDSRNIHDVTAFGDGVHKFIVGPRVVALSHAGYLNSAAAASHPVLKSAAVQGVVSALLGQNANPAVGDPAFSLYAQQGQYTSAEEFAEYVPFSAAFANAGSLGGWGVALAVPVTFTNTSNGTGVNNGAASTSGGTAFLHVLQAAARDTYSIIVQGSPTGAFAGEQTTLVTFSLNASVLGSDYKALSGTIPQYTRWKATRTGSAGNTVKIAVTLVRF